MSSIATTSISSSFAGQKSYRSVAWTAALLTPLVLGPIWVNAFAGWLSGPVISLGTLAGFVIVATALAAAYTDARWQMLPNWLTYSAALWGLAINAIARWEPVHAEHLGAVGLGASVAGLLLLFTLLLIVFSFTGGGAGDVKLAGAIGSLFGFEFGATVMLYAFIAAGIAITVWVVGRIGAIEIFRLIARRFGGGIFLNRIESPTENDRKLLTHAIPLGPFFAVGMLVVASGFDQILESWLFGG
jgi:Flp pilus assembly protein protease CpaA